MTRLWAFIRSEPVIIASIFGALVTIAVALGIDQTQAGVIAAAVQIVLGSIARSQVTPVAPVVAPIVKQ